MEQGELLRRVVETFDQLDLPYFVTGSIATILYGEPRFTNDIDVVAQIPLSRVAEFIEAFPAGEFYLDDERVQAAIRRRSQFNIIHPASGLKIDVMIPEMDEFDQSRFARVRRVEPLRGLVAEFAAPEDVILKKLQYFAEGGSEKHLRDIRGVLRVSGSAVDRDYLEMWASRLGVSESWRRVLLVESEGSAGD